jgi:GntR family transcriptional repressor for pyruvate dehydrogenase complex
VEPSATALAAQRMTDEEIDALVANDLEFHRRIAAGSGNGVLCSLIDSLRPHHPSPHLAGPHPGGRGR